MKSGCNSLMRILPVMFFTGLLAGLFFCDTALSYFFPAWNRGPAGYELSILEAEREGKPLILYFHIEPSEWCEKFNNDYLAAYEVDKFLSNFPRSIINVGDGEIEAGISNSFGVQNLPAFFILFPSLDIKPERIHPFGENGNMSVPDFLQKLKDTMTSHYNQKAYTYFEGKDYKSAVKYFDLSLEFDPANTYTYYAAGVVYHHIGVAEKDMKILQKAKTYFLKVLEIEPEHDESRSELEILTRDMGNI